MRTPLRIVVSGMIAADPHQGGATWAVLQYVLGLRALGHDVQIIEPITPASLQPAGAALSASINAQYFGDVMRRFDLAGALLLRDTRQTIGLTYGELLETAREADLLINISGMLTDQEILGRIDCRVYLDLDPAFNQFWHDVEGIDMHFDGHTHFVTVGCAIGQPHCNVPTCGRRWMPTLQPIVLAEWPPSSGPPHGVWTTVGNWRGYGSIEHGGVRYGQKAHSFRRFMSLPQRTAERFELALAIHPDEVKDLQALREHGWTLRDPRSVAGTPDDYRRFIQAAKGELGVAKAGYVTSRCGWFSDRSVCYLASGRPVVAQATGFERDLSTGEGLLAFDSLEEATAAITAVNADYAFHCRRARDIADGYFRSDLVLGHLLDRIALPHDHAIGTQTLARRHSG